MSFLDPDDEGKTTAGAATDLLNVLLVYEDLSTGLRARRAFEATVRQPELETDFNVDLWRFDLFQEPALRRLAANEAAKADIVFLSAHGHGDLAGAVDLWLRQWLERRGAEPCALVVLLDDRAGDDAAANQAMQELEAKAAARGAQVFLQSGEGSQARPLSALGSVKRYPESVAISRKERLREFGLHSYRDWGINE